VDYNRLKLTQNDFIEPYHKNPLVIASQKLLYETSVIHLFVAGQLFNSPVSKGLISAQNRISSEIIASHNHLTIGFPFFSPQNSQGLKISLSNSLKCMT
jgi:hypothetical protein